MKRLIETIRNLFRRKPLLATPAVMRSNKKYDAEFSSFFVKISHKLARDKVTIIKYKDKIYKVKELG